MMANQQFKAMGFNKGGIDAVFLYVLDAVKAISYFESSCNNENGDELDAAKCRIFWRTLREIVRHNIEEDDASTENIAFKQVWKDFPDDTMKKDGRMWMPMHFAVSVPDINIDDIDILFEHKPESIKQGCHNGDKLTPCHLAVMTRDPDMDLIERLKEYDPNFGRSVTTINKSTPLHLAAECSNSVDVIAEFISLYPESLEMGDSNFRIPLFRCLNNNTLEAPDILQALIDAAPQTASQRLNRFFEITPLHYLLKSWNTITETSKEKMVHILLEAFPEAVNIRDDSDRLPIQKAAGSSNVAVMQMLLEANPGYELELCVAYQAAMCGKWNNLLYIHSLKPEFFTIHGSVVRGVPLLHLAMKHCGTRGLDFSSITRLLVSLSPEDLRLLDDKENNLLHAFIDGLASEMNTVDAYDTLRSLLRLIPGGVLAENYCWETPYDQLVKWFPENFFARRLLLLAGAPTLHPGILKQLNYEARKEALLAFFGARGQEPSGRVDVYYRIRHGAGAMELMRQVVSFL